ncbi:mCG1046403, isoform CRA_a, partial [Mus musculus]
ELRGSCGSLHSLCSLCSSSLATVPGDAKAWLHSSTWEEGELWQMQSAFQTVYKWLVCTTRHWLAQRALNQQPSHLSSE